MIRYAKHGIRRYSEEPWHPHVRHSWEFQAVIAGCCGLWLPSRIEWRTATLWLFPPDCTHGWTGKPGQPCTVCVVHVSDVSDSLRIHTKAHGFLEAALDTAACAEVERLTLEATAIARSDPLAGIRGDRIKADLSLLLGERLVGPAQWASSVSPDQLVDDALAWFTDHLQHRPTVREVAAALDCSPGHLRREFLRVRGQTPHAALNEIRLRRAEELFRDPALSLQAVAEYCGFADGSTFARAYRSARGNPPSIISGRRRKAEG